MNVGINTSTILVLLAIALVFSTVTPVSVSAEDTVKISNTIRSSTETGGFSSQGADGQDGQDGQDGESFASPGKSSVHVESYVDGELVESISKTDSSETEVETVVEHGTSVPAFASDEPTITLFEKLIEQLQALVNSYVDIF